MRVLVLVVLSVNLCVGQGVRLIVDPPTLSVSKQYQGFKVRVANDSDKPVSVLKPTDPMGFNGWHSQIVGLSGKPYFVNLNQKNTCDIALSKERYMVSPGDIITILPGEVREVGLIRNRDLFSCLETDSSTYSFTITYQPVVKLINLTADDRAKLEVLEKRLQSIQARMYELGLTEGFAGTGPNIRDLGIYRTYDFDVLTKITDVTMTSNRVKITK